MAFELCHTQDWAYMHTFMCTHEHTLHSKYACMHTCPHTCLLAFTNPPVLRSNEKWRNEPTTVQIAAHSFLIFSNSSETRVKVHPTRSHGGILIEVTTRLPRGKAEWPTLPLSEMAADAKTVFCLAERRSSIWDHRRNLNANRWRGNYIRAAINTNCHFKHSRRKDKWKKRPKKYSPSLVMEACKSYKGGSVIIFLPVILGLWSHGRGVQRLLALCLCNC